LKAVPYRSDRRLPGDSRTVLGPSEPSCQPLQSRVTPVQRLSPGSQEGLKPSPKVHSKKLTADERKRAEADLANARAIYPTVIECGCGRMMKPGEPAHACNLVKDAGPRSIDVSAAAFQREGLKQALRELEQD
jgi:hypothetical protein